jgi:fibronectin type 3 domain-containing protein
MKKMLLTVLMALTFTGLYPQENNSSIVVREGKDGVFIFFSDKLPFGDKVNRYKEALIYRSISKSGNYSMIGNIKPPETIESFRFSGGEPVLALIANAKKLESPEQAWNFLQNHADLRDYGSLAIDAGFLRALCVAYLDDKAAGISSGTKVFYRVSLIMSGPGGQNVESESSLTLGQPPAITKPAGERVRESESLVGISWKADTTSNSDAFYGEIWRMQAGKGGFEKVGSCFATHDSKSGTIRYQVADKVIPHRKYYYYIVPLTMTLLPGPNSDTISVISADFARLPQPTRLAAIDSAGGIFLRWDPLKDPLLYSGILIERTRDKNSGYKPHDTVPAGSSVYTDLKVIPGGLYYYRLRCITLRGQILQAQVYCSVLKIVSNIIPVPPVLRSLDTVNHAFRISWVASGLPEIAGYHMYRKDNLNNGWQMVSNLLNDSVFTDTTAKGGRLRYQYAVKSVKYDNSESNFSNSLFGQMPDREAPLAPTGLRAGISNGKIVLTWKDMKADYEGITGYIVYRRINENAGGVSPAGMTSEWLLNYGFVRLNSSPLVSPVFSDADIKDGTEYFYAITATANSGMESPASAILVSSNLRNDPAPPASLYLTKTLSGVRIEWDKNTSADIIGYTLYRRAGNTEKPEKLDVMNATKTNYIDVNAISGTLYFYSIASMTESATGLAGPERSIRY